MDLYAPEIQTSWRTFLGAAATIFYTFADTVIAAVLRRRIVALAVFRLDATAAGSRAVAIASPFAPLAVNWLQSPAGHALTAMTPLPDATGGSVGPRHVLGMALITITPVWYGAPQSPAHCLADNQPTAQFISILKQYTQYTLFIPIIRKHFKLVPYQSITMLLNFY